MWTWLLIYCIVLLASYVLLKNYRERHLDSENGCEAPKRYPQLDFLLGLDLLIQTGKMMVENRFFPVTLERYSALGNTFKAKMPGITLINSIEPDNIQSVFATNAGNWGVSWRQPGFVEYCGRGFLNTDGEEWQAARVMLNPSFNKTNIWDHHIYEHHLSLMIQRIPKDGSTVDLQQLVDMLYLDTATLFIFGESFGSLSSGSSKEARLFLESAAYSFETGGFRNALGPFKFLYYDRKFNKCNRIVKDTLDRFIDRAFEKKQLAASESKDKDKKPMLMIDAMVRATDDRVVIRSNVHHAFIAAHETTGHLISHLCWLLARHPAYWTKLRSEVIDIIGLESSLTFDDTQKVPFLKNLINETLRLYPVFPFHQRVAFAATTLPTGGGPTGKSPIYVRASTRFEASYVALHRRKDIYGPDADSFRPERWDTFTPKPWQFIPFSGGPRVCVGRQKALAETSYFLCRMAQEFERIEARDQREWEGAVVATAKNANGCLVGLIPRK